MLILPNSEMPEESQEDRLRLERAASCLKEKGYRGNARLGIRCLTIEDTEGSEELFKLRFNVFL